nr:hypothetical protein [Tanacetum cinerariifolium]
SVTTSLPPPPQPPRSPPHQPPPPPLPAGPSGASGAAWITLYLCTLDLMYASRKHKFHLRPDSPLHLPNEEPILGYLNFSVNGTKREVFGMPIPGSNHDSPAPKPAKATKKSKPSVPKADLRPPVTKLTSSQQPKPKPATAKSQGKKRKLVETSDKPKEHRFDDEEVDVQRAMEESLKSVYDAPRGSLPPMVIREPERTSTLTGSSGHDESSSLYVELGLTNSKVESDEDVAGIDAEVQKEGQAGPTLVSMMKAMLDQTLVRKMKARPDSPNVHRPLQATTTETTTTTTTIHPPPPQPQQSTTDSMLIKRIGELEHIMANLIQDNKHLEERLDSHVECLYTLENLDIPQQ